MNTTLKFVWNYRLKLRAEGNKLWAEGDKLWAEGYELKAEGNKLKAEGYKLYAEGNKLKAEGDKLWAEGNKLWAEGNKLWAEGDKLWAEAILEIYGNIKLEWVSFTHCKLENGEEYKGDNLKGLMVKMVNTTDLKSVAQASRFKSG